MINPYLHFTIKNIDEEEFLEKNKFQIKREIAYSIHDVCPSCKGEKLNCTRCKETGKYVKTDLMEGYYKLIRK